MYTMQGGRNEIVSAYIKDRRGKGTISDLRTIEDLANTMRLTALCGLGHSTAVPVLSSIRNFYPTYLHHIDKDKCNVCM